MTRTVIRITPLTQALLVKLLLDGTRTCSELADETGLNISTVYQYTHALHHVGAAHIADFREDRWGAERAKVFKLGAGTDVEAYAMSGAERMRRHRNLTKHRAAHAALTLGPAVGACI